VTAVLSSPSRAEIAWAIEMNPIDFWRAALPHIPGARVYDGADMLRFVTGIDFFPFNQILFLNMEGPNLEARLDETIASMRATGLPFICSIGPSTRPDGLATLLESRSLSRTNSMPGMAIALDALPPDHTPPGFAIERVRSIDDLYRWNSAYCAGFGMNDVAYKAFLALYSSVGFNHDKFRHYLGLLNGEPVASSLLFLGAGVAGVNAVGVAPAARRQGIGSAMTLGPLREAAATGYRVGTLYASALGAPVYRRLGFQDYFTVEQYALRPEQQ